MKSFLGIELGSTRIKAVLIDESGAQTASGAFDWENLLEGGIWTYRLEDALGGVRESFARLLADYRAKHEGAAPDIRCMGVSAMMHGYLAFDGDWQQIAEFRTWRNTITQEAAAGLTELFGFNIPQRWSVAHLYRAIMEKEPHLGKLAHLTTLAGYVHYMLTGVNALGVGDASGMFPIDSGTCGYDAGMAAAFDAESERHGTGLRICDVLPGVLRAGEYAGHLTAEGARLIDPSGALQAGMPLCPPEGDAGTGMAATNSIAPGAGNVSAGTSVFAMIVLDKPLSRVYPEIDIVTTPEGKPVAMVHCNNCTADLDAWVDLFGSAARELGRSAEKDELYSALYTAALRGDYDAGGVVSVNYLSGEHTTGFAEGRPMIIRTQDSTFTLGNFMRSLLYTSMATLKIGIDILRDNERVPLSGIVGHGGLFKTEAVAQKLMAGALNIPVTVMESAGEGGAWGIALLAAYRACRVEGETLEEFLRVRVTGFAAVDTVEPEQEDVRGFAAYLERFKAALGVEREAVALLKNRTTGIQGRG
ncbi:MAG: FGGY-family carbohydrate kinase [Oscillospiraceae bacterium]|nr:FGGY-family carbohydrate kinase [Oscillospiraceae bacterium]